MSSSSLYLSVFNMLQNTYCSPLCRSIMNLIHCLCSRHTQFERYFTWKFTHTHTHLALAVCTLLLSSVTADWTLALFWTGVFFSWMCLSNYIKLGSDYTVCSIGFFLQKLLSYAISKFSFLNCSILGVLWEQRIFI